LIKGVLISLPLGLPGDGVEPRVDRGGDLGGQVHQECRHRIVLVRQNNFAVAASFPGTGVRTFAVDAVHENPSTLRGPLVTVMQQFYRSVKHTFGCKPSDFRSM
jgi:hypothetical protein